MEKTEETEVCIIGAGAAGGIIAFELAHRGIEVVVLESGPRHDFSKRFQYAQRFLKGENPWESADPALDRHTTSGEVGYSLVWNRARGIGGSTLHWEGYTPRLHENDFRLQTLYGVARDWPISYDDLEPYYVKAEAALGVAGTPDDPWASRRSAPFPLPAFEFSYSDVFFAKACGRLGISFSKLPQARNSVAYRGRAQCMACGTCYVCPTGAKASTELTHIPQAEATGKARVLTNATVLHLDPDETRAVRTVTWVGPDRKERKLAASIFVIAAGGVESPRLLLLSRSRLFPEGLANSSGLVGKYFTSHPVIDMVGRVQENMFPYRVGFSSAMSRHYVTNRKRGSEGAFLIEFLNSAGPPPQIIALESGKTGRSLREHVQREFGHYLGVRVYCEQLPEISNAVSLNPEIRDCFGSPVPHIHYSIGPYERAAIAAGREVATSLLKEAGATDIRETRLTQAAHQVGTVQMGTDPRMSVVNSDLQAHDVKNLYLVGSGCFATASCTHPTLTISALAIRAAERIAAQLGRPN